MAERDWTRIERLRELGLLVFIGLLSIAVQVRNPAFLTMNNLMTLLTNTAILGILAIGMMLVLVTRGIDLSPSLPERGQLFIGKNTVK
ncbi:MAG: ABC transporter permease [Spirochaetales bacterium]|nr:ABC transporter permease [Spirochaetales bacterium]